MARPVDADVLIKDLTAMKKVYDAISLDGMIKALKEAPTIEAEPVKHGKWEFGRQNGAAGYWCTNCKSGFTGENAEWIAKEHDYCPNCGARMDGE